jgi:DNA replication and repair protein RecF
LHVDSISVRNFRNLDAQTVSFTGPATVVIGRNGQGKTSLIEAIYLLAQAKSFRSPRLADLIAWGGDDTVSVEGILITSSGEKTVRVEFGGGKRSVFLNGNLVTSAKGFYGEVIAVEFTPDDLQLIKGGPSGRRLFLDRILSMFDRTYVEMLVHYNRALKHRNQLLSARRTRKRHQEQGNSDEDFSAELEPWNQLLVRYGSTLAQRRALLVQDLSADFMENYGSLANSSLSDGARSEEVCLQYCSDFLFDESATAPALRPPEELLARYSSTQDRDLRLGATSFGPHRDELEVTLDVGSGARGARASASQGQARSMTLALKIAATRLLHRTTGEAPILLLDDVESELDGARRAALHQLIRQIGSQVIVTATELSPEVKEVADRLSVLSISGGKIEAISEPQF